MIYGVGNKQLGEINIPNQECPNCKERNSIYIHGIARYFHVFWIPVFPVFKKYVTICHACEVEIPKKERSQSLKDKVDLEKSNFKIPIYLFIGLVVILGLIVFLEYESRQHTEFVESKIHHLETDDVLVFKQSTKEYTFAKVESVQNDTIYFVNSNYSIDDKPTLSDYIDGIEEKEDFFDDEIYLFSQKEIDSLHKIGEIDLFEVNK